MAELLVFTVLGSIVALYSVVPRDRQLRVTHSLTSTLPGAVILLLSLVILGGFVGILHLQNTSADAFGPYSLGSYGVSVSVYVLELAQTGAALVLFAIFAATLFGRRSRVRNDEFLVSTLRRLYNRGEYGVLTDVIEDNYTPLVNHPDKPSRPRPWPPWGAPIDIDFEEYGFGPRMGEDRETSTLDDLKAKGRQYKRAVAWTKEWLWYFLLRVKYAGDQTAERSAGYVEKLMTDPGFAKEHAAVNPDLGIKVIEDEELSGYKRSEIFDSFMAGLFEADNSLLYRELRNNRNRDRHGYRIEPGNRLLRALFDDCTVATRLAPYKVIGDATRNRLREGRKLDWDEYNDHTPLASNQDPEKSLGDPVLAAIRFFDIMISEAIYQGISDHLWLYYYDFFTEEICRNFEITEYSKPEAEIPNAYGRFLYEMTNAMDDWLAAVEELSEEADGAPDHLEIKSANVHRGGNIGKAAAICLCSCHQRILSEESIPTRLKRTLTKIFVFKIADFREHDKQSNLWKFSEVMLNHIEERVVDRGDLGYLASFREAYSYGGYMARDPRSELLIKGRGDDLRPELDHLLAIED